MAKILIAPVSTGLSADAAAKAFAAALNAQVFQAVDSTTEALLAQGKRLTTGFDALVGKVAALNADNSLSKASLLMQTNCSWQAKTSNWRCLWTQALYWR